MEGLKPKKGDTVIAPEDCDVKFAIPNKQYKVVEVGSLGYYVRDYKSSTTMLYVFYSDNWQIKEPETDWFSIIGAIALILLILIVLLRGIKF